MWGDGPVSGEHVRVPLNQRQGASLALWEQGHPVHRGQRPAVPGTFQFRQPLEPPVSRGCSLFGCCFVCPASFAQRASLPPPAAAEGPAASDAEKALQKKEETS